MPHTLKSFGLVAVVAAALGVSNHAAPAPEPPSASPSGGARIPVQGHAVLTREQLAEIIRDYREPDPADFAYGDGEDHEDDEARVKTSAAMAPYVPPQVDAAALEAPALVTSWKAINASGGTPADATLAVSTTHVLVTNRAVYAMFDKAGTPLGTVQATKLFANLGLNSSSFWPAPIDQYFDVRAIFDPFRKRFW